MTPMPPFRARHMTAGALVLSMTALPSWAQDEDAALAPKAELTIGQQIAVDNGDVIGITPIGLNYQTGTRAETLQFSMSMPLEEGDPDEDDFVSFGDAQARLFYRRGARNSAIEAELSYRESDLDREILFDDISNELVTVDRGSVAHSSARLGYVFGTQSKVGGEIGLQYSRRNYSGTTDASLDDSETKEGHLRLYLEPTPLIRARLVASGTQIDSDGGTDSRFSDIGAGASLQVDKLTNLDVEIAHTKIRREEENGFVEETTGPTYRLNLSRARPAGEWTLAYASAPGTEGRRDDLTLGHSFERPNFDFSAALGVTHFQGNYDPIFQLGYDRELSRVSRIQASLDRSSVTDNDGDEAINTTVSASYSRQLSEASSMNASVRYRSSDVQTGDRSDAETMSLDLNYSRTLYSELSLVAGANIIRTNSDNNNGEDDDDERVYLGLSRSFNWLP